MINLEIIILFAFACLFCGWVYSHKDLERPTLKRFIYTTLIVALFLVALGLAFYFAKLLFKEFPDWLLLSVLFLGMGILIVLIISFCWHIILAYRKGLEQVKQGELTKSRYKASCYRGVTVLCFIALNCAFAVAINSRAISTWLVLILYALLSIGFLALIIHWTMKIL